MNESHDSEGYHHAALTISINIGSFSNAQFFDSSKTQISSRWEKYDTQYWFDMAIPGSILIMTSNELHHHL